MKELPEAVKHFFRNQNFVIVTTVDENGFPHSSCKGIVRINRDASIYLLDLYKAKTYENLKKNGHINITAVDEHRFAGYCLKGEAEIIKKERFDQEILKGWEERITTRITQRVLKNIRGEKGHHTHPETLLPKPEYMIKANVVEIIDLTPHHLK